VRQVAAQSVAVIGGGWAGLACAVALADAGIAVTVFEAADVLGGRARRVEHDGLPLDNGQHLLLGAYRQTLDLIHRVQPDAPSSLLYARLPLCLAGPGSFRLRAARLPAPLHTLAGLFAARGCTWTERFAVARAFIEWHRAGWRAPPAQTVAGLLARQPPRMRARLWDPLCLAALNTPPDSASAQVFLNVLRDGLGASRAASDLVIPVVDLSRLFPEPAAAHVVGGGGMVRLHARVRAIAPDGDGVLVIAAGRVDGAGERVGSVVIATAPWQAVRLLAGVPGTAAVLAQLQRYRYEPICTISLRLSKRIALPHPMLQLAGGPAQWVFDRTTGGAAGSLLAAVISADGPYRALSHDALADAALAQLRDVLGTRPPDMVWARVITERRATHACTPERVHPAAGRVAPLVYLAGDHTDPDYPATLEAATRSGMRAAEAIVESG
jgi:squalene-associated FAD-dependent desaturase